MDFTKKILPGDKLDISLTNAENDAVYKSMFSDLISEKMWEITMPVSAGRIVLLQVGEPFSFILYTSDKVLLEGSAIVRKRYKKENLYFWSELDLKNYLKSNNIRGFEIQRYKGLGEMSYEELRESTMNKDTRRLIKVTIDDIAAAEEMLSVCMYDKNIAARKQFILSNKPGGDMIE